MNRDAGIDAVEAAYTGLERVLLEGLQRLPPESRAVAQRGVMEQGGHIEFAACMGDGAFIACELVAVNGRRVELFRVELGSKANLHALN